MSKLIYVEDDDRDFEAYARGIRRATGMEVIRALDNGDSLNAILSNPDLMQDVVGIISDIERPGRVPEGLNWARAYVQQPDALPVLLISLGYYSSQAQEIGVRFLGKGDHYKECRTFGDSVAAILDELRTPKAPARDAEAFLTKPHERRDANVPDGTARGHAPDK